MRYYVDTCVWVNILKKENRFYAGSLHFLKSLLPNDEIFISDLILREVELNLGSKARDAPVFKMIRVIIEEIAFADRQKARKLESEYHFTVGFGDLVHLVVSQRLNATLVTRDNLLIRICKEQNIAAMIPETYYPSGK